MQSLVQTQELNQTQKIDMIFRFLFWQKAAEQEEVFWNVLKNSELQEITEIRKEPTKDFSVFKEEYLWKK